MDAMRYAVAGSSPRLRGTHAKKGANPRRARFIPAPAGNTLEEIPDVIPESVHPRACGEHFQLFPLEP